MRGDLKPGDRVLSEAEICDKYNVSRISSKRALDELSKEGYIRRISGKGSFVTFYPIDHLLTGFYSLSEEIKKLGMTPTAKLLDFNEITVAESNAADALKQKLFLYDNDRIYFIKRLRLANDEIIALDETYIPVKYYPSITEEELLESGSLYAIMEKRFNAKPDRAQEYFYARPVCREDALILDVGVGSPALKIVRVSYSRGNPVEYNSRIYKGEKFIYRVDLQMTTSDGSYNYKKDSPMKY